MMPQILSLRRPEMGHEVLEAYTEVKTVTARL